MQWHSLDAKEWGKAVAVGIAVSILTAVIMAIGLQAGVSPLPKPLGLAFAETVLGGPLPLPVGLLFHTVWVTAFSALYVVLFRDALTFMQAFWLALALWILVLVFFFPGRRLGLSGSGCQPQADCGRRRPAPLVCVVPLGSLPLGVPA